MHRRNYKTKVCSTCQYWHGKRNIGIQKSNNQQFVQVESNAVGICENKKTHRSEKTTQENMVACKFYIKWDQLIFDE